MCLIFGKHNLKNSFVHNGLKKERSFKLSLSIASTNYRTSASKRNKVKCRICKSDISEQNCKVHLKENHPEENPDDLRQHKHASTSSIFGVKRGRKENQIMKKLSLISMKLQRKPQIKEILVSAELVQIQIWFLVKSILQ